MIRRIGLLFAVAHRLLRNRVGRRAGLPLVIGLLLHYPIAAPATEWETEWEAAFARARAENKLVLVDFFASWCKPCLYMESDVLPHAEVQRRLADFVLLRVDYDKVRRDRRHSVTTLPAFVFFDPWERVHFMIVGGNPPERFAEKVDPVRLAARSVLEGSRMISEGGDEARGRLMLGRAYLRAGALRGAAAEFKATEGLASRRGDAELAQLARIDRIFADALSGNQKRALAALHAAPVGATGNARAYRHLVAGRIHRSANNRTAAVEEYQKALEAALDEETKREAELALATLGPAGKSR